MDERMDGDLSAPSVLLGPFLLAGKGWQWVCSIGGTNLGNVHATDRKGKGKRGERVGSKG